MKRIFLESHNIDNLNFGFGQFNYHLIKAFYKQRETLSNIEITLSAGNTDELKKEFKKVFSYHTYSSLNRHKLFRNKTKYDLWHSMNQNTKVEPFFDIPYLMTVHDVNFMEEYRGEALQKRKKRFEEKLKRCQALVYISNFTKASTHKYFTIPDIPEYVIYNGNPMAGRNMPSKTKPEVIPSTPFLFTIGEFLEKKNFHTLVEMLVHLPEYSLVIAGKNTTSYAQKIQLLVAKYKLENRVLLPGKISEGDKYYYFQNAAAFVFPSLREGFGIPPIEAMTFGKPVFLSNKTSLPEIGGQHAFYWDHFDPEYMAKVFRKGLEDYNNDSNFYEQAYNKHADSFSWEAAAKEYLEVYRSLLK